MNFIIIVAVIILDNKRFESLLSSLSCLVLLVFGININNNLINMAEEISVINKLKHRTQLESCTFSFNIPNFAERERKTAVNLSNRIFSELMDLHGCLLSIHEETRVRWKIVNGFRASFAVKETSQDGQQYVHFSMQAYRKNKFKSN